MASDTKIQKIDVHNTGGRYATVLEQVRADRAICPENRQHIVDFLTACELGKTVFGKEKKRIGERRLLKYLMTLRSINRWLGNKDFRHITNSEMEQFVARVDRNDLDYFEHGNAVPRQYTDWTRRDIKVCVKKFYKWLLGGSRQYPDLVVWIDTHIADHAPPCLSLDEIRRCVDAATTVKGKALVWALFETGARAEELLNVRLCHVKDKETHHQLWIEFPKTFKRNPPVFEGSNYLRQWIAQHPNGTDPTAQLFPMSYASAAKFLRRLGQRAIGKKVTPHLLRHSFATYLASKKVGRYQMTKLMGWSMSSSQPDRYIDRVGVVEEEAVLSIRQDELSKVERENAELKHSLQRLTNLNGDVTNRLAVHQDADDFLHDVLLDPAVVGAIVASIKKRGLGKELYAVGKPAENEGKRR